MSNVYWTTVYTSKLLSKSYLCRLFVKPLYLYIDSLSQFPSRPNLTMCQPYPIRAYFNYIHQNINLLTFDLSLTTSQTTLTRPTKNITPQHRQSFLKNGTLEAQQEERFINPSSMLVFSRG